MARSHILATASLLILGLVALAPTASAQTIYGPCVDTTCAGSVETGNGIRVCLIADTDGPNGFCSGLDNEPSLYLLCSEAQRSDGSTYYYVCLLYP